MRVFFSFLVALTVALLTIVICIRSGREETGNNQNFSLKPGEWELTVHGAPEDPIHVVVVGNCSFTADGKTYDYYEGTLMSESTTNTLSLNSNCQVNVNAWATKPFGLRADFVKAEMFLAIALMGGAATFAVFYLIVFAFIEE